MGSSESRAARLLRSARQRADLSQAELARRAGMPRPVVNAYERGHRQPGVDALDRLLAAAGYQLQVGARPRVDPVRNAGILQEVLDLAEQLPSRRPAAPLTFRPTRRVADPMVT